MREILFRGKRTDNGEWIIGFYEESQGKCYINWEETIKKYEKSLRITHSREVISETTGQYTGLTDKNGKRIFDGDICTYDEAIGVVEFCEDNAMFTFTYDENIETNFGCMWSTDLEVIGNIHDNPELLKGECENDR